jgi:uroporphyrinogen-III decarboxylase
MTVAKVPARKFYSDANLHVSTQIAVGRWYGTDGYTIAPDIYNVEIEALGAKFIYSDNAMPTPDVSHPLISSPADLAKLKPIDTSKGRIPFMMEVMRLTEEKKAFGRFASGFFCSPWSMICGMMGYPPAVRALRKNPQFAKDLFAYTENEVIAPYVEAANKKTGFKVFVGADAWACFPDLSLPMMREWILPSARRLLAVGKPKGLMILAALAAADYCEEDPAKFDKQIFFACLDMILEIGSLGRVAYASMGRTQDWDPHWMQEFATSRGGAEGKLKIAVCLNSRFVRDSKPEVIVEKVRQWVDICGREGVMQLCSANVPADTPSINMFSLVNAVHTLGKDPMPADLSKVKVETPKFKPFDVWLKGQPEEEVIRKAREK